MYDARQVDRGREGLARRRVEDAHGVLRRNDETAVGGVGVDRGRAWKRDGYPRVLIEVGDLVDAVGPGSGPAHQQGLGVRAVHEAQNGELFGQRLFLHGFACDVIERDGHCSVLRPIRGNVPRAI